jgi:hypothetical protein
LARYIKIFLIFVLLVLTCSCAGTQNEAQNLTDNPDNIVVTSLPSIEQEPSLPVQSDENIDAPAVGQSDENWLTRENLWGILVVIEEGGFVCRAIQRIKLHKVFTV